MKELIFDEIKETDVKILRFDQQHLTPLKTKENSNLMVEKFFEESDYAKEILKSYNGYPVYRFNPPFNNITNKLMRINPINDEIIGTAIKITDDYAIIRIINKMYENFNFEKSTFRIGVLYDGIVSNKIITPKMIYFYINMEV